MKQQKRQKREAGKEAGKYSTVKGNIAILFLYLLHYPDYAYNIAKTFKELSDRTDIEIPSALTRYSNVHKFLSDLEKEGLIKRKEIKTLKKSFISKKVIYRAELSSELAIPSLFSKGLAPPIVYMQPFSLYNEILKQVISKEEVIKTILSLKTYDFLTVLIYVREGMVYLDDLLKTQKIKNSIHEEEKSKESDDMKRIAILNYNFQIDLLRTLPWETKSGEKAFQLKTNPEFVKIYSDLKEYTRENDISNKYLTKKELQDKDLIEDCISILSEFMIPYYDELIFIESKTERGFMSFKEQSNLF